MCVISFNRHLLLDLVKYSGVYTFSYSIKSHLIKGRTAEDNESDGFVVENLQPDFFDSVQGL